MTDIDDDDEGYFNCFLDPNSMNHQQEVFLRPHSLQASRIGAPLSPLMAVLSPRAPAEASQSSGSTATSARNAENHPTDWTEHLSQGQAWEELQAVLPRPGAQLLARTWYLNSLRQLHWEVWRPLVLGEDITQWEREPRELWRDFIDPNVDLAIHFVAPDPPRPPWEMSFPFDIILTQNLAPEHRPAIVVTRLLSYLATRFRTTAELLPLTVSKWQLIYHVGNDQSCSGISWHHDFFRLCQVWHEWQLLGPEPFQVSIGDSFVIDISPPEQLPVQYREIEDDDDLNFLQVKSDPPATASPTSNDFQGFTEATRLPAGIALSSRDSPDISSDESGDDLSLMAAFTPFPPQADLPIIDDDDDDDDDDDAVRSLNSPEEDIEASDEEGGEEDAQQQPERATEDDRPRYAAIVFMIHSPLVRTRLALGIEASFFCRCCCRKSNS